MPDPKPDWTRRFSLAGRTALITGASSGIGQAIAEVFADAGADILGQGRDLDRLAETGARVTARGRGFSPIPGDLADAGEVQAIAARALGAAPRIDILVNSAGIALTGPAVSYGLADWQRTLAVNLTAPFLLAQALLPGMMERRLGKIINISSQTGVIALQDHAAYATSKGGLNALTKSLMVEAAPHNVQVNAICPTVVLTEMGKTLWSAPERRDPFIARTPLGRFGDPVEIADLALYLASPASDLVNGEIVMIEGVFQHMKGFGVHTSMWTMRWDAEGAARAIAAAKASGMDFIEIALLDPAATDAALGRRLLEQAGLPAVCSLGLPPGLWASDNPEGAIGFLTLALETCAGLGATALTGVTYGGIGERTGQPPTVAELDNVARVIEAAARIAKAHGLKFGIEPVNRYETHLINTAAQGVAMIERVGADNLFLHLDTYHMNIEEKGQANGILTAREHLRYIHLSESDRGTPGMGTCDWDAIFAALAAIGFEGGLAMESFVNMPPEIAHGLSVWRPVAESAEAVIGQGLPFLRNKARQYGLIERGAA